MRGHYRAGVQTGDRGGRELQRQGALGWRGVLGGQGGLLFYSWISTLIKCRINDALSLANNSAVFLHSTWVDTSHSFLFLAKSVSDSISLFVSLLFYLSLLPISLCLSLSISLSPSSLSVFVSLLSLCLTLSFHPSLSLLPISLSVYFSLSFLSLSLSHCLSLFFFFYVSFFLRHYLKRVCG